MKNRIISILNTLGQVETKGYNSVLALAVSMEELKKIAEELKEREEKEDGDILTGEERG